ncbi:MAG: BamA/TamA family outer membrane protein [Deltaproteobacteria bacterium]|nr:BamA/TamA family outer membrane protein [Deltaproteobacteria bacterium]
MNLDRLSFILIFIFFGILSPLKALEDSKSTIHKKENKNFLKICENSQIFWKEKNQIKLNSLEKKLICGDPKVEAWSEIPFNQAKYHLSNFLQARAYHQPTFQIKNGKLQVNPGKKTLSRKIILEGAPDFLKISKKRDVLGRPMTPELLDKIENWVLKQLRSQGYPCPTLKSKAYIEDGEIILSLQPGPKQKVFSITEEQVEGLSPGAFRKYDAFQLEKSFNADLLDLTSTRNKKTGVLQSSYFTWTCETEGAKLYQRTFAGKPRLFTLGFGASTDEWGIFKSSWRHARLGKNASNLEASLYASYFQQSLEVTANWYAFSSLSRWFIRPKINLHHELEDDFHFISLKSTLALGRSYDNQEMNLFFYTGPSLDYTHTFSGAQSGLTRFLTLDYFLEFKSHDWEIYQGDPQKGYHLSLWGSLGHEQAFSSLSAQSFRLQGQYLYNVLDYDPARWIIGIRGGLDSTYASEDPNTRDRLPPNLRYYLGGSQNLRGFSRKELPGEGGALSALWLSLEVRLANFFPLWIEPIVFFDIGLLGQQAFRFDKRLYYSPGIGIRLDSPIGVFRGTLAHGFQTQNQTSDQNLSHWQWHLSYGEEF